jgi:hypothetical protein
MEFQEPALSNKSKQPTIKVSACVPTKDTMKLWSIAKKAGMDKMAILPRRRNHFSIQYYRGEVDQPAEALKYWWLLSNVMNAIRNKCDGVFFHRTWRLKYRDRGGMSLSEARTILGFVKPCFHAWPKHKQKRRRTHDTDDEDEEWNADDAGDSEGR